MKNFNKEDWVGLKFKCKETGEILVIPDDVRQKDFFSFGNCFVDVGDGYYARFGGEFEEIEDDDI